MCARYALSLPLSIVAELFGALIDPDHEEALRAFTTPRFRILPGQTVPIVRLVNGRRVLQTAQWGWSPTTAVGRARTPQINVRMEGLQRRATMRTAETHERCLVPATGWYEFTGGEGARTAWFFSSDALAPAPVAFAGLLQHPERLAGPGFDARVGESKAAKELKLAVITRDAAPEIRHLHERMPAALNLSGESWLNRASTPMEPTKTEEDTGARWFARPVNLQGGHTQDDDVRMLLPPAQTQLF